KWLFIVLLFVLFGICLDAGSGLSLGPVNHAMIRSVLHPNEGPVSFLSMRHWVALAGDGPVECHRIAQGLGVGFENVGVLANHEWDFELTVRSLHETMPTHSPSWASVLSGMHNTNRIIEVVGSWLTEKFDAARGLPVS